MLSEATDLSLLMFPHLQPSSSEPFALARQAIVGQNFAHRVKDLESLQNQVAQNHGKELVDEQALEEMELLRHRVMQLEGEASSRAEDSGGPAGHGSAAPDAALADLNAELMHEMEEVRRRVMELQVNLMVL